MIWQMRVLSTPKRAGMLFLSAILFAQSQITHLAAAQVVEDAEILGPVKFSRFVRSPNEYSIQFARSEGFLPPYRLIVTDPSALDLGVSAGSVILNDIEVVKGSDFNSPTRRGEIVKEVILDDLNRLNIRLASKPGTTLTVTILGKTIRTILQESDHELGTAGGTVEIDGFASVTVPPSDLLPALELKLSRVIAPHKVAAYSIDNPEAGPALSEVLDIVASDGLAMMGHPHGVLVSMVAPPAFVAALGEAYRPELFARFVQVGANEERIENYLPLGAYFDEHANELRALVPIYAFAPDNSVVTSIIVGSYPNAPSTNVTGANFSPTGLVEARSQQKIALSGIVSFGIPPSIRYPFDSQLARAISSGFGLRLHPKTQIEQFHAAVDLVSKDENVHAVLPGVVVRSRWLPNGCGFGVIISHSTLSPGLTSGYCHLAPPTPDRPLPREQQSVTVGDVLGVSDTSGGVTGPHLHLTLRVDGHPVNPQWFLPNGNPFNYVSDLKVAAFIVADPIVSTERQVDNSKFEYKSELDLSTLSLEAEKSYPVEIKVQNKLGTSEAIHQFLLSVKEPKNVVLTVTNTGNGTGAVTSSPPGIACGVGAAICSTEFSAETIVTLTASPDAGSKFLNWGGACAGNLPSTSITLLADSTCSAVYDVDDTANTPPSLIVDPASRSWRILQTNYGPVFGGILNYDHEFTFSAAVTGSVNATLVFNSLTGDIESGGYPTTVNCGAWTTIDYPTQVSSGDTWIWPGCRRTLGAPPETVISVRQVKRYFSANVHGVDWGFAPTGIPRGFVNFNDIRPPDY